MLCYVDVEKNTIHLSIHISWGILIIIETSFSYANPIIIRSMIFYIS